MRIETWIVVRAMQIALGLLPFRVVHRFVSSRPVRAHDGTQAGEIAAAVDAFPRASCLARVLAGALLLARHGHESAMRLGITKSGARVDAHAWLESGGRAIVGAPPPGTTVAFK